MGSRLIFVAALASVLGVADSQASAQSVNYCIDQCFNIYPDNQLRDMCVKQCGKPKVTFGAIAYGPESEATGWSYDYETEDQARHHALSNCAQHGNDCRVVTSFSNSCGAVAAGTNKRYAIGEGVSENQAQADAIANCNKAGGTGCDIQAWSCTNR
ncbi:MAG: DUF4189 domain-containing protein [Terriglobia bacterium]